MENSKIKLAVFITQSLYERSFHKDDLDLLFSFAEVLNPPPYPDKMTPEYMKQYIKEAEVCYSCWGTPPFSKDILDCGPGVRLILHGAGTPKAILSDEVWVRGIRVATCAPIIAKSVAETALGAIIFMRKKLRQYHGDIENRNWRGSPESWPPFQSKLTRYATVGIISASHVGRNLIRMLEPFGPRVLLYDPFVSKLDADALGVTLVDLPTLMRESDVVSCHAPKLPETDNLVSAQMLALMKDGALFVNTARGSCVDESALIAELKTGRIGAYLDVFNNEPIEDDNGLIGLPNVILSPHISGTSVAHGIDYERGAYLVNQLFNYVKTGRLQDETIKDMIKTMA